MWFDPVYVHGSTAELELVVELVVELLLIELLAPHLPQLVKN